MLGRVVIVADIRPIRRLPIVLNPLLEVKFGKGADIAEAIDVYGKFPEEINDMIA